MPCVQGPHLHGKFSSVIWSYCSSVVVLCGLQTATASTRSSHGITHVVLGGTMRAVERSEVLELQTVLQRPMWEPRHHSSPSLSKLQLPFNNSYYSTVGIFIHQPLSPTSSLPLTPPRNRPPPRRRQRRRRQPPFILHILCPLMEHTPPHRPRPGTPRTHHRGPRRPPRPRREVIRPFILPPQSRALRRDKHSGTRRRRRYTALVRSSDDGGVHRRVADSAEVRALAFADAGDAGGDVAPRGLCGGGSGGEFGADAVVAGVRGAGGDGGRGGGDGRGLVGGDGVVVFGGG